MGGCGVDRKLATRAHAHGCLFLAKRAHASRLNSAIFHAHPNHQKTVKNSRKSAENLEIIAGYSSKNCNSKQKILNFLTSACPRG